MKIRMKLTTSEIVEVHSDDEADFREQVRKYRRKCVEVLGFAGILRNGEELFKDFTALVRCEILPRELRNAKGMFEGCVWLRYVGRLPVTLINCESMFKDCIKLDQAILVPSGVKNINSMFENCKALNSPITFKTDSFSVFKILKVFNGCSSLHTPIAIPIWGTPEYPIQVCKGAPGHYDMSEKRYIPDNLEV